MKTKKKITFVCSGNYYRSRYAESYFNYISDVLGLPYQADSFGLAVHLADDLAKEHGEISPFSRKKLEDAGIPEKYFNRDRKSLTKDDIESSDFIIAMDKEEHVPMIKEKFPKYIHQFNFFEIKDIFDWEPEKTLSESQKKVEMIINQILKDGEVSF